MKLQMWCIILLAVILVTEIHGMKCRNNDERSKDEFTEVAVICMYNMSNWDRPNMNSKDYNNGRFNNNRNYNYYQNPNDNNSNNRNNYNNNQDMYNRDSNQDSMYNRNNRNNYNKYNHDDNYGVRSWRRQQSSRGYGNNDDNTDEEEEEEDRDNQRSNQREQSNQRKNNYRNSSNNNNNNNKNYNNNGRNKNNSKKNEDNENSDSLLELSGNSPLEQVEPCLVHCIFKEMHLLDEEAMPDKTLVINVMTKRLHDSQVIDFVEESVEDCFELLDTDDKRNPCEFTKNLALCLEEKGRRNCEDWEDQNGSKSNNRNSMNPKRHN